MWQINQQYKRGLLKLAVLLALLFVGIFCYKKLPNHEPQFLVDVELQCVLENQEALLAEAKAQKRKSYTYDVNKLTDFQGYQLGLTVAQLDALFAYRKEQTVYSLAKFQEITQLTPSAVKKIAPQLRFPKYRKKSAPPPAIATQNINPTNDINKVTAKALKDLGITPVIAYRLVKFRKMKNGFTSMTDLEEVWDISPEALELLNQNFKIIP